MRSLPRMRLYDCCEHCEHDINDPPHDIPCPEGCGDARSPVAWLRAQVEADLATWRGREAAYLPNIEREGEVLWFQAREHAAQYEAMLAVLDLYERQEAKAGENAMQEDRAWTLEPVIALLASAYKHRSGYDEKWGASPVGAASASTI